MRMLVIFSSPSDKPPVRLDREDKTIMKVAQPFGRAVSVKRLHASTIDDVHSTIRAGNFDVIQISGHGDPNGVFLEKPRGGTSELVSAASIVDILGLATKSPLVAVFLSCYSDSALETLARAAPFVVTSKSEVSDDECITFVEGFYESLLREGSVCTAFDRATQLLAARGCSKDIFRLSRYALIENPQGLFVKAALGRHKDPILVNLDAVRDRLGTFGLSEEQICYEIARKLRVHSWIFERARENATIPVGRLLFGEFRWEDVRREVRCTRLMKLRCDLPPQHWEVWAKLLTTYNDLASSEYRSPEHPATPLSRMRLQRAVNQFTHHVQTTLVPLKSVLEELGFASVLPHIDFSVNETERARLQLEWEQYPQVVEALEMALTNYHEVVTAVQPPEEVVPSAHPPEESL